MPVFSVLIPVYNVEKYLSSCLDSVLGQDFSAPYEVIVVDDGSTDLSGKICDEYQRSYPQKIRVIHKKNEGLLLARRTAIKEAKGKYFVFVDSDDAIRKDALRVIYSYATEFEADMVIYLASVSEDYALPFRAMPYKDKEVFGGSGMNKLKEAICKDTYVNNMWMKAVKRDIVDINEDYTPYRHVRNGEDAVQSLALLDHAAKAVYCEQRLYFYRLNPSSMTHVYHSYMYESIKSAQKLTYAYAEKWDKTGRYLEYAKQKSLVLSYQAITQILVSAISWKEKRAHLVSISEDPFFKDILGHGKKLNAKQKLIIALTGRHCYVFLRISARLRMNAV